VKLTARRCSMHALCRLVIRYYLSSYRIITSAKEVMFSPLSVCLSVNRITKKLVIKSMKFYGMVQSSH